MPKKKKDQVKEKIYSLESRVLIYLHPDNKNEMAFLGKYNTIIESEGLEGEHIRFHNKISFKFNKKYKMWIANLDFSQRIVLPIEDVLNGSYNLYAGSEEIQKAMEKYDNFNKELVKRIG